ncbi:MAG TPA: NAD(P)/FAD-dependent oxidoreductase [Thermoanaerobaculia bacterium]|jgi:monoamine oxidase
MAQRDVIVIGGGAAGLAATRDLSAAGLDVLLLEGRNRLGGRVHTLHEANLATPVELGPEFVHGQVEEVFRLVRGSRVLIDRLPDRHEWNGRERPDFWKRLERILGRAAKTPHDVSFAEFLARSRVTASDRKLAAMFVEGYHAADLEKVSSHSLSSGSSDQFRVVTGYDSLLDVIRAGFAQERAEVRTSTIVTRVAWRRGEVEVGVRTRAGAEETHRARAAVVTLPLGVLRSDAITWDPRPGNLAAVEKLEMGNVCKIVFAFRESFWPAQTNFVHASGPDFPTWWTHAPAVVPLLTAWTGGPAAARLLDMSDVQRVDRALASLAKIFAVPRARLDDRLDSWWTHDWRNDPFSRGAYSYTLAGGMGARKKLAAPVRGTIVFAGEACEEDQSGTVAGAIASGRAAACKIAQR